MRGGAMLKELDAGLWIGEMRASRVGFEFGARMTVIRLPDAGLWIHSPIALTAEWKAELDAIGPVRAVLSPSKMHYEHVPELAAAYPEARVFAVPNSAAAVRKKCRVDGILTDTPDPLWSAVMEQAQVAGSRLYDEVVFLHRPTRTLILTDLCFNIPESSSWSTRLWARALGVLGRLSVSRSLRPTLRDRRQFLAFLDRVLAWDFDRVLITHGDCVLTDGKDAFLRAVAPVRERK